MLVTCVWLSITEFSAIHHCQQLTGGGPNYATQTLSVAAYKEAFTSYNFGTSAAIGVLWMVFLFVLTMLSNHFSDRFGRDIV